MSFRVDVVSPEGVVWSGQAEFLLATTTEGDIGILTDHEPLMAALATGPVKVRSDSQEVVIGVHGGFLQVLHNQVTLLTDRAEMAEGDLEAARRLAEELAEREAGAFEGQEEEAS
ncbi:MAG: F0F1 ATP synthase subunit epsilon [Actinomycetota bacterium]|nr:F0F1 ATP synthase subunit epsilon [Actinomycetota bacterium]